MQRNEFSRSFSWALNIIKHRTKHSPKSVWLFRGFYRWFESKQWATMHSKAPFSWPKKETKESSWWSHFSPYGYIRQQDITREEEIFYFYNFFFSHASSFPENYVWDTVKPNMNISLSSNLNLNLLHYQRLVQPSPHWFLLQFIYNFFLQSSKKEKKWKKYCKILILQNIEY